MPFGNFVVGCVIQIAVAGYFIAIVPEKFGEMEKLLFPVSTVFRIFRKGLFSIGSKASFSLNSDYTSGVRMVN